MAHLSCEGSGIAACRRVTTQSRFGDHPVKQFQRNPLNRADCLLRIAGLFRVRSQNDHKKNPPMRCFDRGRAVWSPVKREYLANIAQHAAGRPLGNCRKMPHRLTGPYRGRRQPGIEVPAKARCRADQLLVSSTGLSLRADSYMAIMMRTSRSPSSPETRLGVFSRMHRAKSSISVAN